MPTHSSILAKKIPRQRSLADYRPPDRKESVTTERLSMHQRQTEGRQKVLS